MSDVVPKSAPPADCPIPAPPKSEPDENTEEAPPGAVDLNPCPPKSVPELPPNNVCPPVVATPAVAWLEKLKRGAVVCDLISFSSLLAASVTFDEKSPLAITNLPGAGFSSFDCVDLLALNILYHQPSIS